MKNVFVLLVLCSSITIAQFIGPLQNVTTVATLPATCVSSPAQIVEKTGASAGFYSCIAGVWTGIGPSSASDAVTGAAALTGSKALLLDSAAGTAGLSALTDNGTQFLSTATRAWGLGTHNRTGNTLPSATKFTLWDHDVVVGNTATLGSESLADGTFTVPTWTRTGDFTVSTGAAVYTHSTGSGTFTQLNASMAIAMAVGKWYKLVGNVSTTGTAPACSLTSATADTTFLVALRTAVGVGVDLLQFKSAAVPTGVVVSCTSSVAGTVTYDNLVLKEIAGGDLNLSGNLYARGATLYGGSGAITGVVRAGLSQSTANLWKWQNAAGTDLSFVAANGTWQGPTYAVYSSSFGAALEIGVTTPKLVSMKAGDSNTRLSSDALLAFTSTTNAYSGTVDMSLARSSAGIGEVVSDGVGKPAGLRVGTLTAVALATPGAPMVTPTCTGTCASTWTYTCTSLAGDLTTTVPGAAASTLVNATTLDGTHYNTVVCPANAGTSYWTVRRTVSGGTPATLGALATCTSIAGLSCVDNGLVGDAGTAPTGNTTGAVVVKLETPAASAATCTAGAIWADTGYIYVCTASGTVERVAVAAW